MIDLHVGTLHAVEPLEYGAIGTESKRASNGKDHPLDSQTILIKQAVLGLHYQ